MAEPHLPLRSIGALLRTTRVMGREARSFSGGSIFTESFMLTTKALTSSTYWRTGSRRADTSLSLSPGLYRVVTLREAEEADNYGQLATPCSPRGPPWRGGGQPHAMAATRVASP